MRNDLEKRKKNKKEKQEKKEKEKKKEEITSIPPTFPHHEQRVFLQFEVRVVNACGADLTHVAGALERKRRR